MEITKLSVGFIGEGTPLWQTKVLFYYWCKSFLMSQGQYYWMCSFQITETLLVQFKTNKHLFDGVIPLISTGE
jgi:hypothetical protein